MIYAETHGGRLRQFFKKKIQNFCMFPLEKLTVLTAGPGNIPHTPKQQAADGKDYVEEQSISRHTGSCIWGNITDLL